MYQIPLKIKTKQKYIHSKNMQNIKEISAVECYESINNYPECFKFFHKNSQAKIILITEKIINKLYTFSSEKENLT